MGAANAKDDVLRYRNGYPGEPDDLEANDNLNFYKNKLASTPHGDFIDNIHVKVCQCAHAAWCRINFVVCVQWKGNYQLLEAHHGYIQWLFPIREHGMNAESQKLQFHEIEAIKADPECLARLVRSYELMLDFYGIKLKNNTTGELERADNWKGRYAHLNSSFHNYLRITRILKCLGEFGYEAWKKHFIDHFIVEVWEHRALSNCGTSCQRYWVETLRDDTER